MNKSRPSKLHAPLATGVPLASLANDAADAAALLKALANPDRLLLLCHLVEDERNVSALEALTGIHQPTLSQQLGRQIHLLSGLLCTRTCGAANAL